MKTRMDLHRKFKEITPNVYFQPPETIKMVYPAIVYFRARIPQKFADDQVYKRDFGYQVTVIDKDPESVIAKKLLDWPKCLFDRSYNADNLNHTSFMIYE